MLIEASDYDDVYGKIDRFASDKGDTILAVQVKANATLEDAIIESLSPNKTTKSTQRVEMLLKREESDFGVEVARRMNARISDENFFEEHPDFEQKDIVPIITWVPSGFGRAKIKPHNGLGEPTERFVTDFYDKLEKELGWDQDH